MRVTGSSVGGSVEVEVDEWIPLKASWWPRRQIQPFYVRISNVRGRGEAEFKLDPESGSLLQFILIEEPPIEEGSIPEPTPLEDPAIPIFDLKSWERGDDLEGAVVSVDLDLSLIRSGNAIYVGFCHAVPATKISSGPVEFQVSQSGELVALIAQLPSSSKFEQG